MNRVVEYFIKAKDLTASTISQAKARIVDFAKTVGTNLMNIKAGFDMARGVVSKFVGFFTSAIGEAFKFEKAVANFKTLTGSIDNARAHLEDLRKFAAATPLTLDDLSRASKLLLSFGTDVKDVMPALKMLGDISMGDAQKFQGLALVFAQVKSAGKLMGQDLLQMINQGFNPLTIIAEQTGKSVGELKDLMSKGAISFQMVEEAMRSATSAGGLFAGAMDESAKTGEGLLSTLKDNWTDAIRTFGDGLTDVAKNGIQFLIDYIKKLKDDGTIQEWAEKAKTVIMGVVGAMKGLSEQSTRKATLGAMKDVLVGAFETAASAAAKILVKAAAVVGQVISKTVELSLQSVGIKNSAEKDVTRRWEKEGKFKITGLSGSYFSNHRDEFEAEVEKQAQHIKKTLTESEMRRGIAQYGLDGKGGQSRLERGWEYLANLGRKFQEEADANAGGNGNGGTGGAGGAGGKGGAGGFAGFGGEAMAKWQEEIAQMQEEVQTEYAKAYHEYEKDKTSEAAAYRLQLLQEYYDELANCANKEAVEELKKQREVVDKKIDFIQELEKEQKDAAKRVAEAQEKADLKAAEKRMENAKQEQTEAESRMQAAQEAVSQAWGWYKDKDSLKQQIASEEQNILAQRQYAKDYKSLTHGRWSNELAEAKELQRLGHYDKLQERMAQWRKGPFGLSVEDEATMRVALAQDEQKNAAMEMAEVNENTKAAADNLEAIRQMMENGGGQE